MGYFRDITTGQSLEDVDISVHCDITVFEWLMAWIKHQDKRNSSFGLDDDQVNNNNATDSSQDSHWDKATLWNDVTKPSTCSSARYLHIGRVFYESLRIFL
mgnify:CR=1 FL=1